MATTAEQKPTLEVQMAALAEQHDLSSLHIAVLRSEETGTFFSVDALGDSKVGTARSRSENLAELIKEAIGDLIIKRAPVIELIELPAIEVKPTIDQWDYKGWAISYDMTPIPDRSFDWTATSPDYDVDCDQDGFFRAGGQQVHAATYEALLEEIECVIADAAEVVS